MTNDKMDLQALLGKSPDADFSREMIGFAAERLMELEGGGLTGAAYGDKSIERLAQVTATASAIGRPVPAPSSCVFPSAARANIFRASSSHAASPRRR